MSVDQFGRDLEEDLGYDLDLLDESSILDENDKESFRIKYNNIRFINGDIYDRN